MTKSNSLIKFFDFIILLFKKLDMNNHMKYQKN